MNYDRKSSKSQRRYRRIGFFGLPAGCGACCGAAPCRFRSAIEFGAGSRRRGRLFRLARPRPCLIYTKGLAVHPETTGGRIMASSGADTISLRPLSLRPGGGKNPFAGFAKGAGVGLKLNVRAPDCSARGAVLADTGLAQRSWTPDQALTSRPALPCRRPCRSPPPQRGGSPGTMSSSTRASS